MERIETTKNETTQQQHERFGKYQIITRIIPSKITSCYGHILCYQTFAQITNSIPRFSK